MKLPQGLAQRSAPRRRRIVPLSWRHNYESLTKLPEVALFPNRIRHRLLVQTCISCIWWNKNGKNRRKRIGKKWRKFTRQNNVTIDRVAIESVLVLDTIADGETRAHMHARTFSTNYHIPVSDIGTSDTLLVAWRFLPSWLPTGKSARKNCQPTRETHQRRYV